MRKEVVYGVIIFVLLAFAGYSYILSPKLDKVRDLKKKITEAENKIREAENLRKLLVERKQELDKLESEYGLLEAKLPKATKWEDVVKNLSSVLGKSGLRLNSMRVEKESVISFSNSTNWTKDRSDNKTQVPIVSGEVLARELSLDLSGKYRGLESLVINLKESAFLMTPNYVRVDAESYARDPDLKVNLRVNIYRYVERQSNETKKK